MSREMSPVKTSALEDLRMRGFLEQQQKRNDAEIHDLEVRHLDELQKLAENQSELTKDIRHAYEVQISEEAEALESQLLAIRASNDQKIQEEKKNHEEILHNMKMAQQQRVDAYRKNGELQLEALRKQFQDASKAVYDQAKRSAQKAKEIPKS